jgi:hypothetical protein
MTNHSNLSDRLDKQRRQRIPTFAPSGLAIDALVFIAALINMNGK